VDLAIRAMQYVDPPIKLLITGDGTQRENMERLAEECGVAHRVRFLGTISDDRLLELYADALAVLYAPFDEDFGYVTLEAFLARRPVITATDAGGPLEFVEQDVNGTICDPDPEPIGAAINRFAASRAHAATLGHAGYERARTITWDGVIEKLMGASTS
jgi:glycosyltransferase involved in cell wall biosynthesis